MSTATRQRPQTAYRTNKPGFGTPQRRKYFLMWQKVCTAQNWKPSDDAKRHAVTRMALGSDVSSNDFNNSQWDHVYNLLELLADDLNLGAAIERSAIEAFQDAKRKHVPKVVPGKRNPNRKHASDYEQMPSVDDPGERKRLEYFISRLFMPSYIRGITVDRFDEAEWKRLNNRDLTWLKQVLRNRLSKWLTGAKNNPREHGLPLGVPVSPRSTTGMPTNDAYIQALLDRGSPVDMRQPVEPEGDPF